MLATACLGHPWRATASGGDGLPRLSMASHGTGGLCEMGLPGCSRR